MKYESKFSIGDSVVVIRQQDARRMVNCFTCKKIGQVTIGGEQFTCPKCHGASQHPEYVGQKWYVDCEGKIGQIEILHTTAEYSHDGPGPNVKYMIDTTGIGTGTNWREADTFATREEAEAACATRNANTNWADDK